MQIRLTYSTIDHGRKAGVFKTLKGARKFAHRWVGPHPDVSETFRYAVSADGTGKLTVEGVTLAEVFPSHTGDDCPCRAWVVTDLEAVVDGRHPILERFPSENAAARWIERENPTKALRGGFGLDGPAVE